MFFKVVSYFIIIDFTYSVFRKHFIEKLYCPSIKKRRRLVVKPVKSKFFFSLIPNLSELVCNSGIDYNCPVL